MKKFAFILSIISMSFTACGQKYNPGKTMDVTFKKDKLIEVALFKIKPGMEDQVNEYFGKAIKLVQPYGKPLASFTVTGVQYGKSKVGTVAFFEWKDINAYREFTRLREYVALKPDRDIAFEYLSQLFMKVPEDVTHTFEENAQYESIAFWMSENPNEAAKMDEYFQKVGPEGGKAGFSPAVSFQLQTDIHDGSYNPDVYLIGKWQDEKRKEKFFKSNKIYKQNVHLREAAAPYKEVLEMKFNFPPQ